MTRKYQPLSEYLERTYKKRVGVEAVVASEEIPTAFTTIEMVIGAELPRSARTRREWWANTASIQALDGWMRAGFLVIEVDLAAETVTFRKE